MRQAIPLKLVPTPPKPSYDDGKGRKGIIAAKSRLLQAALSYIENGKDGTLQDRIRTASDLAQIPRNILEVEVRRRAG